MKFIHVVSEALQYPQQTLSGHAGLSNRTQLSLGNHPYMSAISKNKDGHEKAFDNHMETIGERLLLPHLMMNNYEMITYATPNEEWSGHLEREQYHNNQREMLQSHNGTDSRVNKGAVFTLLFLLNSHEKNFKELQV